MRKIETCIYHYMKTASKHCSICRRGLCKYCGTEINGQIYCKECQPTNVKSYHFEAKTSNAVDKQI